MIEKSLQNSKTLGFTYPHKNHGCFFIWPWEYSGKFLEYFYFNETGTIHNQKSSITTRRIFGFTFVSTKWLCDPLEAYYLYRQGLSRLIESLKDVESDEENDISVSNIEKQVKLNNRECCGNDCGCH